MLKRLEQKLEQKLGQSQLLMWWFELTIIAGFLAFMLSGTGLSEAVVTVYFAVNVILVLSWVWRQRRDADDGAPLRNAKVLLQVLSPAVAIFVIALFAGEQPWNRTSGVPYWMKLLGIVGSIGSIGLFSSGPPWKWSRGRWTGFAVITFVLLLAQTAASTFPINMSCWTGWLLPGISDTCR